MKIPKILKSKVDEQKEIDKLIKEGEKLGEEGVEEKASPKPKQLEIEIQKLWAQVKVLREVMKMNDERFQRLSENIGDIRQRHVALEKDLNQLELKAKRSIELVEAVQPQKLLEEVKREDIKVMSVQAKTEANKKLLDHIIEKLRSIRSSIDAFKGTEAVMKLNKETMENLKNIGKIQARINQNSEKVEDIFVQVQKRYDKFLKLSDEFKALEKQFDEVMKRSNKFIVKTSNLVTKEELNKFRGDIESRFKSLEDLNKEMRVRKEEFDKIVGDISSAFERIEDLGKTLRNKIVEIDDEIAVLNKMKQMRYVTKEEFNKELDDLYQHIIERIEESKK